MGITPAENRTGDTMVKLLRSLFLAGALSCIGSPLASYAASSGQDMYVQVRSAKIRSTPEFWGASVSGVSYGDKVGVIPGQKGEGGWLKVKGAGGKEGYLHVSALTSRKVVLRASDQKPSHGVSSSDVVLAGKGFSKEVEANYSKSHALNYKGVDQIERERIGEGELRSFVKGGNLGRAKGKV